MATHSSIRVWKIIDMSTLHCHLSGTESMWPRKKLEVELKVLSCPEISVKFSSVTQFATP